MRVVKEVRIRFVDREANALALFDTGSSYTVVRRSFFEKVFGATWAPLPRPVKLCLANGRLVSADKYAAVTIVIDGVELSPPETVLILDEFVEEVEVKGKELECPT